MYTKHVKLIVVAKNANGSPDVHTCEPLVTQEQHESGDHYALGVENAEFNGYEGPMIVFDEHDDAATRMAAALTWLKGSESTSHKLYEALKKSALALGITDHPQGSRRGELADQVRAALKAFEAEQQPAVTLDASPSP